MADFDLEELAEELSEFAPAEARGGQSAQDERIIAGFEEIQLFVDKHGRVPRHGAERDIFERLYAVRLDRLRSLPHCVAAVEHLDRQGLFSVATTVVAESPLCDLDELAAELTGIDLGEDDITVLRHVRTNAERRAADEVADRKRCEDFVTFKPLFERVGKDLKTGLRQAQAIRAGSRAIEPGDFFILDGITIYIAEVGEPLKTTAREVDCRLRVIFANGTESNLLLRSLQRAFYDDPGARRVMSPKSGQLSFGGEFDSADVETGTIYVLRSLSDHSFVAQNRELVHKIGVTGGNVASRINAAESDATYLLAKVEVVATYRLAGINHVRMEKLFHKLFAPARLDITINDRFGRPVQPQEWFLVPLFVVDEAVERLKDGTITNYIYDPTAARLVKAVSGTL